MKVEVKAERPVFIFLIFSLVEHNCSQQRRIHVFRQINLC